MQIRIKSIDELTVFIQDNELNFDKYLEIVQAYVRQGFIWVGAESKENLISELNRFRSLIEIDCVPIFWNDANHFKTDEFQKTLKENQKII